MGRIQAMQMFMRVAGVGGFVRTTKTLSLPVSTVTSTIKDLEKCLKVRLLSRTTRQVDLTPEGLQHLAQCRGILALIEHSEFNLSESVVWPQGRPRVDIPAGVVHLVVMPHLLDFYWCYPDICLMTGVSDRQADLIQGGVGCAIHMGELNNSSLAARPLGCFRWVTYASPCYLGGYGMPSPPETLSKHRVVHYFSGQARRADEFRFIRCRGTFFVPANGNAVVNETGLYIKMRPTGFGLAQLAENIVADYLQERRLAGVLTDWQPPPVPVTLLYPHQRFPSSIVWAFAEWMSEMV